MFVTCFFPRVWFARNPENQKIKKKKNDRVEVVNIFPLPRK